MCEIVLENENTQKVQIKAKQKPKDKSDKSFLDVEIKEEVH